MSKDNENAASAVDPNILKGNEVARAVIGAGTRPDGFKVDFRNNVATLTGTVRSEEDRQRVLAAARTAGVSIDDKLTVGSAGSTGAGIGGGRSYTVKSGDTLGKIARAHYGDASKYNRIFEANRNILSDPDRIQPGQVLVIPE
ncbi:MAG TPA: LysM peptidoglycan-binding domain-containing protein [Longimicrobiales bacterium]|nr:LysM peptidoglycan-binding domain-containing protein [Longimicrobiales bacterium]